MTVCVVCGRPVVWATRADENGWVTFDSEWGWCHYVDVSMSNVGHEASPYSLGDGRILDRA